MGLLDNNNILTTPKTGLEGSNFELLASNEFADVWQWSKTGTQKNLRVTFRDIFVWSDSNALYMVKGNITDELTTIAVNNTNFPNLRQVGGVNPTIEKVIACPTDFTYKDSAKWGNVSAINGKDCRICVIFTNGQIYHNYPACQDDCDFYNDVWALNPSGGTQVKVADLFTKFDESVVWDLPTRKHPVKTQSGSDATLLATGKYYYNPALPENSYEIHPAISAANGYGNTVGFPATNDVNPISSGETIIERARFWLPDIGNQNANCFAYMGGYVADNLFTMLATYRSNKGSAPCRMCIFGSQDGGRSWYCMYEFGGRDKTKVNESYRYDSDYVLGIKLAQVGTAGDGIYKLKCRYNIVPCAEDKEPSTPFGFDSDVNISSIVGTATEITVTTASAHNLRLGDAIVIQYQDNVSADGRAFDWMVNDTASTESGGNGILFKVHSVSGNSITLSLYIWNPDNNIGTRHIHALNRCKDGVSVSCGEEYPFGGWILYNAIKEADAYAGYNVGKLTSPSNIFVRLNSTEDSFQRPLGVIIQQEGLDTYCYIGSDNEFTPMSDVVMPEGRTESFKHNSCGVWKVKLQDIDSQKTNGLLKLNAKQTAFGFQQKDTAFVYTGQFGALAISYDNGETWTYIETPYPNFGQDIANFSGMTYDRKFSVNNILVQLKK